MILFPFGVLFFPNQWLSYLKHYNARDGLKTFVNHHGNKLNLFINHRQTNMGNIEWGKISRLFGWKGDLFFPIQYFWPKQFFWHKNIIVAHISYFKIILGVNVMDRYHTILCLACNVFNHSYPRWKYEPNFNLFGS